MNKDELLKRLHLKEDKMLVSNILDKYIKYDKTGISTHTNFLDLRTLVVVENILKYAKIKYNVYKTNDNCEKSIIYFGTYDNYVSIYKMDVFELKHPDILGTLFSVGFNNETIGDIFVFDDSVYITNLTKLNTFLESSLFLIKNRKVSPYLTNELPLIVDKYDIIKVIVPSYRLDVFVSKLANLSRVDSSKYISSKLVYINNELITNTNKIVKMNDIISIRKVGKFIILEELYISKKDNFVVSIGKYI